MQSGSSIRLHRRSVYLDGGLWTILTPRPGDPQGFSTGVEADSVHVRGPGASMEFLAHALWALAFQHKERTALLFDLPVMVPNPTTGESSRPIVWVNAELGSPSPEMLDGLRELLPLESESDGTLKLRTAGLDRALQHPESFAAKEREMPDVAKWSANDWNTWVTRQAGLVTAVMTPGSSARLRRRGGGVRSLLVGEPRWRRAPVRGRRRGGVRSDAAGPSRRAPGRTNVDSS